MRRDKKATFGGGKVKVYDDNLTDISENLFWFREMVDHDQVENAAGAFGSLLQFL